MKCTARPALRDRTAASVANLPTEGERPSSLEHALARSILQRAGVALAVGGTFATAPAQSSDRVPPRTTLAPSARANVVSAVRLIDGQPQSVASGGGVGGQVREARLPPRRTVQADGRVTSAPTFDMP